MSVVGRWCRCWLLCVARATHTPKSTPQQPTYLPASPDAACLCLSTSTCCNVVVAKRPCVQFMGIVIGSAVVPIAFSITWAKCSTAGAVSGAISGLIAAVITWIAVAKVKGDNEERGQPGRA